MPDKLTDNEIIKALECCWHNTKCVGDECPFFEPINDCAELIAMEALSLINRQKAELDKLNEDSRAYVAYKGERGYGRAYFFNELVKEVKAEAIKEVMLQLEAEARSSDKYIREYEDSETQRAYNQALWKAYNLVKEMVGEDK